MSQEIVAQVRPVRAALDDLLSHQTNRKQLGTQGGSGLGLSSRIS